MSQVPASLPSTCRALRRARGGSRALRAAFAALLFACASPALARDYIVELVLFENLGAQAPGGGGYWVPGPVSAVTLGDSRAAALGIVANNAPLALADSAAAMASSGRYRILQHLLWQQPGLAERDAVRLRIALGQPLELFVAEDAPGDADFLPAAIAPRPDRPVSVRSSTLAGTLELSLGRFLHLDSKLVYTDTQTGRSYRLDESRKMRSRELHYIDNPRFGILTRIVPAEDAEQTLDTSQEDAPTAPLDAPLDENGEPFTEDGGEADDILPN